MYPSQETTEDFLYKMRGETEKKKNQDTRKQEMQMAEGEAEERMAASG